MEEKKGRKIRAWTIYTIVLSVGGKKRKKSQDGDVRLKD